MLTPYLFNQAIVSQLSTFPLGTPAGGLTYTFDPGLGTYSRSSTTFGPTFLDRALTIGRGRFNFGANYQHAILQFLRRQGSDRRRCPVLSHASADRRRVLRGRPGRDGTRPRADDRHVLGAGELRRDDRFDVGVAVPILHVSLDACDRRARSCGWRRSKRGPPRASTPSLTAAAWPAFTDSGSATGFGDILCAPNTISCRAPVAGSRPPSTCGCRPATRTTCLARGDPGEGLPHRVARRRRRFSPHFNIGYTCSGQVVERVPERHRRVQLCRRERKSPSRRD